MMKRLIGFLVFFIGGSLLLFTISLMGCHKGYSYYMYKDITTDLEHRPDPELPPVMLNELDTANADNFSARVVFEIMNVDRRYASRFLMGNAVYAFQYDYPTFENIEGEISDIRIVSLFDYNNDFPSGSDVSGACLFSTSPLTILDDKAVNKQTLIASSHNYGKGSMEGYFHQFYFYPPVVTTGSRQQFVIEVVMEQNTIVRDTTAEFFLKP